MNDDSPSPKDKLALWERPVVIAGALLTLVVVASGGGFKAGQHYSESKALAEKSELVAEHAQAKADLKICSTTAQTEQQNAAKVQAVCASLTATVQAKDQQIADLSRQLGLQSNCTFIHEQIRSTQADIERPSFRSIMASGTTLDKDEAERKAQLQQRLAGYQQQLGTCDR
jgi:hypothetical protein